ncbi:DUF2207 domain-containing protein [Microbacterium sp. Marseille-Q6965]|uniref:DUF2207 domain-containing protein n=1 Tax=Microbacterium sp. Marseille-Q6965 TaxID=2965072 RepID=UPI0021B70904|nr:DUF2207 domain-containing protein [Microbacterium sp. Marseille-Q6965]
MSDGSPAGTHEGRPSGATGGNDADPLPPGATRLETRRPSRLYVWLAGILRRLEKTAGVRGSAAATASAWIALAVLGAVLLLGPVINAPKTLDDYLNAAETGTETWIAREFRADYEVVRRDDGGLELHVEERITAFFTDDSDETSIERTILSEYDGRDVGPVLVGARFDGEAVDPDVRESPTQTTYRIETGERLQGDHELVLRYTLRDVLSETTNESTGRAEQLFEWDAFGPDWSQGTAAIDLSLSVPHELVDSYARQPRAMLGWLFVSDTSTLEPDAVGADAVTYRVTNEQNLPPDAQLRLTLAFQPGTFATAPETWLYWVMVIGPFAPLLLMGVVLLFALAARAVIWRDAPGGAWYLPQHEPPKGVDVALAARVWRAVRAAPLAEALEDYRRGEGGARQLAMEAHRAGRLRALPRAWKRYVGGAWRETFARGYRRVPRGVVRTSFLLAALALPLLQLGLARQLSHQFSLSRYWWPVAVVAVTIGLAVAVLTIVLTDRPLTRKGAALREHLMGMRDSIRITRLEERGGLRDPMLPYAVLFARPRRAAAIVRRAASDAGVSLELPAGFGRVDATRIARRVAAALAVAAAVVVPSVFVSPVAEPGFGPSWDREELPGHYGVAATSFEARAELTGGADPTLVVVETMELTVADRPTVPQLMREWTDRSQGHDAGLRVTSVTIDGEPVEFVTDVAHERTRLRTLIPDTWAGEHEAVVRYEMTDPIAEVGTGEQRIQQLRWIALDARSDWAWSLPDIFLDRLAFQLTVPREVADAAVGVSGAIDSGPDTRTVLDETDVRELDRVTTGDTVLFSETWDGDRDADYFTSPDYAASGDLGVQLQFPEGTFPSADDDGWVWWAGVRLLAVWGSLVPGFVALAAVVAGIAGALRRRPVSRAAWDRSVWMAPAFTLAQAVLFVWATADATGDEIYFVVPGLLVLVNLAATTTAVIVAVRRRR